jgi:hypothetical protein
LGRGARLVWILDQREHGLEIVDVYVNENGCLFM